MRIVQLGPGDERFLEVAVRQFRELEGVDHRPFLHDPGTIAFLALVDVGGHDARRTGLASGVDVIGWAWGLRQRHVAGYSQVQLHEIEVVPAWRRRAGARDPRTLADRIELIIDGLNSNAAAHGGHGALPAAVAFAEEVVR